MCLHIKYVCPCCRNPVSDLPTDKGEACRYSLMSNQVDEHEYNLNHRILNYRETIPLDIAEASENGHACKTKGCTYHPEAEFTNGFHPEFGPMARCPGCDNIFSVATNALDNEMIGGLQRYLSHRADARVPILAPQLWSDYHCTAEQNGCLWSGDVLANMRGRLDAIRAYMNWSLPNNPSDNAPPQRLYAHEEAEAIEDEPPFQPGDSLGTKLTRKPWTEEDEQTLKTMKAEGRTAGEIAVRLERTTQAIWTRSRELRRAGQL